MKGKFTHGHQQEGVQERSGCRPVGELLVGICKRDFLCAFMLFVKWEAVENENGEEVVEAGGKWRRCEKVGESELERRQGM